MKVVELTCFTVALPVFDGRYVMSRNRVIESLTSTIIRARAEDGTVGYAEACTLGANYLEGFPASVNTTVAALAPVVLGANVFEADTIVSAMDSALLGHLPGKAVIDTALWDLRGKLLGQPVARLLGGVHQTSFSALVAVGLGTPEEMADSARRYSEHGFRAWQLKLGDDPLMDARRTHAVAETLPSDTCFLTSDANAGWTSAQALRYLAAIEGIDAFLEQPCRTVSELSRVKSHTDRPLLVDESVKDTADLLSVIGLGLGDALNIKPTRVGGLTKAAKLRDICVAAGLMILVDEPMGADLATGATSQLAASVPSANLIAASFFSHETMPLLYRPKGRAAVSPTFDAGTFRWNEAPGLGVEIDESTFGDPIAVYRLEDVAH